MTTVFRTDRPWVFEPVVFFWVFDPVVTCMSYEAKASSQIVYVILAPRKFEELKIAVYKENLSKIQKRILPVGVKLLPPPPAD